PGVPPAPLPQGPEEGKTSCGPGPHPRPARRGGGDPRLGPGVPAPRGRHGWNGAAQRTLSRAAVTSLRKLRIFAVSIVCRMWAVKECGLTHSKLFRCEVFALRVLSAVSHKACRRSMRPGFILVWYKSAEICSFIGGSCLAAMCLRKGCGKVAGPRGGQWWPS
ncbi:MAG: hypothetical protein QXT26_08350, partial [Thermoproteota archaeon]